MIKSLTSKVTLAIVIMAVVYSGSFVMMEETLKRTERAEGAQEAIHYQYHSTKSNHLRDDIEDEITAHPTNSQPLIQSPQTFSHVFDYNVDFIYCTSFLDTSQTA